MPSWRNSSEKRKEKSAVRAKRHREMLGIPEWPPLEDEGADFHDLSSLETEELLLEIDRLLAGNEPTPTDGVSPVKEGEKEEPKRNGQKPPEPSVTAVEAAVHATGEMGQKPPPGRPETEEIVFICSGEQLALEPSMAAAGAVVHTTGKEAQEQESIPY